jgi:tetratricopeptide (TPR) repeat protein
VKLAAVVLSLSLGFATPCAGAPHDVRQDGSTATQSGDISATIQRYREFLQSHPHAAEIRSNLGAALVQTGQFADAIVEYSLALQQLPNNPRVRMNLALAYFKLGRLQEAIEHLEALHKQQPLEVKPALLLGDCLMETNQPAKAVETLTPLHSEYPDDHAVVYALGMALMRDNRVPEAQVLLDGILKDGESAEAAFLLGQSALLRNDLATATERLARAVELDPKMPWVHTLYGQALKAAGRGEQASAEFAEELKVNSYDFTANSEIALLLVQDGKPEDALAHVNKALQVRPNDPGALYQRASIHLSQGLTEQSGQELEQLTKNHPNFSEAHAALARVYYKLERKADGDREAAEARRVREEAQKELDAKRNAASGKNR